MSDNRISMVVSPEQKQAVLAAVAQARSALPGLLTLAPGELPGLHRFGAGNEIFGRGVVRALQAHPGIVPPNLDVAAVQADLDALDALRPLRDAVALLHAQLDDTAALLAHDVMDFAYEGYQLLKLSGNSSNGLDELRRELGAQFKRRRQSAEPAPAG